MRHQWLRQYTFYFLCFFTVTIFFSPIFSQSTSCPNRSEWMRNAPWLHNRSLYEITLPGTHDSGAYMLYNHYLRGFVADWIEHAMELAQLLHIDVYHIVKMWALSQTGSVAEQLRAGARYIDLRCSWNGTAWVTFHFEQGVPCSVLMRDVSDFLNTFTSEIVYVELGSESSPNKKEPDESIMKLLYNDIRDTLLPYHIPTNSDLHSLTLHQLVKANTRCLIASPHRQPEYKTKIFISDSIIHNSYAYTDNLKDMIAYNDDRVREFNHWKRKKNKIQHLYKTVFHTIPRSDGVPGQKTCLRPFGAPTNPRAACRFEFNLLGCTYFSKKIDLLVCDRNRNKKKKIQHSY